MCVSTCQLYTSLSVYLNSYLKFKLKDIIFVTYMCTNYPFLTLPLSYMTFLAMLLVGLLLFPSSAIAQSYRNASLGSSLTTSDTTRFCPSP